jgi:hypothetical protein
MDRNDVLYGVAAILIVLLLALIVKPMIAGQLARIGTPVPEPAAPAGNATLTPVLTPVLTTPEPAPVRSPAVTATVQAIGFVDPSVYGIRPAEPSLTATRFDNLPLNTTMVSFARINGSFSGTTRIVQIPFPYWELVYTVDPVPETIPAVVTPVKGSEGSWSGVHGSYSGARPEFTIQVVETGDPGRIVRNISPPGGIDLDLWTASASPTPRSGRDAPAIMLSADPRPWTERFFEGERSYYFIITAKLVNSYSIDIQVPARYTETG